jgi:hypothetical protein
MRRRRRNEDVLRDPEVLEELHDEPELLALADAVYDRLGGEYRHKRRSARTALIAGATAAAAGAVVLVLIRPWGAGGPSLVDEALAAIPERGPVLHAVLQTIVPDRQLVDLSSGRSGPDTVELEFWFDGRRDLLHTLVRNQSQIIADILATPQETVSSAGPSLGTGSSKALPEALVGFASGYREALAAGEARAAVPTPAGRPSARWLEIDTSLGRQLVALDPRSLLPREIRTLPSGSAPIGVAARVLHIATTSITEANFRQPRPAGPEPSGGAVTRSATVSISSAAQLFARRALWVGPRVDDLELRIVKRQRLVRFLPPTAPVRRTFGTGLDLVYGAVRNGRPDWRKHYLEIQEAPTPEPAYGYLTGILSVQALPRPGFLVLERQPQGSRRGSIWVGRLRSDGFYLTLTASGRSLVVNAARTLRPVPLSHLRRTAAAAGVALPGASLG